MICLLAMLLALAMVMSACGAPGNVAQVETDAPTQSPTEAPTEQRAPSVKLGTIKDGKYKNMYAGFDGFLLNWNGIACDFDDSWTIYSAEELQELSEHVKAILDGAEWEGTASTSEQFWDIQAENLSQMTTVNVLYTGLGNDLTMYQMMSEERVIDMVLSQESVMIKTMENAGYSDVKLEKMTITFLGEEHVALKTSAKVQGVDYYTLQVFDYSAGPYSVTITAASFIEDKTQSVLDMFYPVSIFDDLNNLLDKS